MPPNHRPDDNPEFGRDPSLASGGTIPLIHCESCRRSLVVSDPTLAGTIATCPACGSMVAIPNVVDSSNVSQESSESLRYGSSSVQSDAVTADGIEADGIEADGSAAGAPPVEAGTQASTRFQSPPPPTQAEGSIAPTPAMANDPSVADSDATMPASFQSESATRLRRYAASACLAVLALVTIGVLISALQRKPDPVAVDANPNPSGPASIQTSGEESSAEESSAEESSAEESSAEESSDRQTAANGAGNNEPADAELSAEPSASEMENSPPSEQSEAAKTDTADETATAFLDNPSPDNLPPNKQPPPSGLPPLGGPMDLFGNTGDNAADASDADAPTLDKMPSDLDQFTPLLLAVDPSRPGTLPPPPTLDDFRLRQAADGDDPLIALEQTTIRADVDLALKVAIKSPPRPITRWIHLISQLSGVPIQCDLVAFDVARLDITQPFAPEPATMRLQTLLDRVAESVGGVVLDQPTFLSVAPTPATLDQSIDAIAERRGLPGAGELIDAMMPSPISNPSEPSPVVDADTPVVDPERPPESRDQRILRAILTDTLRRMRGVDPLMGLESLGRWSGELGDASLQWPIRPSPDGFTDPMYPIALSDFIGRLEIANEASTVVYWPDLLQFQWTASTMVFPDSTLDPASLVKRTLSPVQCQVRQIDSTFDWLGSDATYDRLPVVVFAIDIGDQRDRFQTRLTRASRDLSPDAIRWVYDATSDGLLMLMPRFVARQIDSDD